MIIGIDGNEANLPQRVGVGQFAFNLLKSLSQTKTNHQFHIYLKSSPLPDMPPASPNWHYHIFGPSRLWTRIALPLHLYLSQIKLDFFYSPSHYSPLFSPFLTIPTIHDLGYLDSLSQFTKKDAHQLVRWTETSIKKAYHIVAVSEFTKHELIRIYHLDPQRISVVPNGVSPPPIISPKISIKVLSKFGISQPYFLTVGTLKPNKNLPFMISAFAQYLKKHSGVQLVIAGKKGWLFNDIFQTVQKEGIDKSVVFTDFISETEKWSLYKNAIATIIPSTYEGFGIPAIESQQSKVPVIAASIPALTEVLADTAIFIDPTKVSTLVTALDQVTDQKLRSKLITLGFAQSSKYTWTNSAKTFLKIIDTI